MSTNKENGLLSNNEDPDVITHSAASHLGLCCLSKYHLQVDLSSIENVDLLEI